MNKLLPLVTIGVGSFNNSKYVVETLDSIKNQEYENLFLIVVDDCSTDSSVFVVDSWMSTYSGEYLFIKNSKNLGISAVGNLIRINAKGKYLSFIGSDDVLLPTKISSQVRQFEKLDDSYAIVYGDTMKIGESGTTLENSLFSAKFGDGWVSPSGDVFNHIVDDFFFYTQSSLIKIQALELIQFKFDGRYISEDWYMQLKLAQKFSAYGLNDLASKYRIVPTSMGARFWNVDKQHIVLYSQFRMFNNILSSETNLDRCKLLLSKLRFLLANMRKAKNVTKKQIIVMNLILVWRSKAKTDLKTLFSVLFR